MLKDLQCCKNLCISSLSLSCTCNVEFYHWIYLHGSRNHNEVYTLLFSPPRRWPGQKWVALNLLHLEVSEVLALLHLHMLLERYRRKANHTTLPSEPQKYGCQSGRERNRSSTTYLLHFCKSIDHGYSQGIQPRGAIVFADPLPALSDIAFCDRM